MKRPTFGGIVDATLFSIAVCLFAILALIAIPQSCHAQASMAKGETWGGPFHTAYVVGAARAELEAKWSDTASAQVERGYCIMPADIIVDTSRDRSSVDIAVVTLTNPVDVVEASPYSISLHCPSGYVGSIHTHTPTTCVRENRLGAKAHDCYIGGPEAYMCQVDEWDRIDAVRGKEVLAGVQCDKHAIVWYFRGKRG